MPKYRSIHLLTLLACTLTPLCTEAEEERSSRRLASVLVAGGGTAPMVPQTHAPVVPSEPAPVVPSEPAPIVADSGREGAQVVDAAFDNLELLRTRAQQAIHSTHSLSPKSPVDSLMDGWVDEAVAQPCSAFAGQSEGCASCSSGCASCSSAGCASRSSAGCASGDCSSAYCGQSQNCSCVGPCVGCCQTGPSLIVSADYLALYRHRVEPVELARGTANPGETLNANDHQFDWSSGFQVGAVAALSQNLAAGARFQYVDSLNAPQRTLFVNAPLLPLRINSNPPAFAPDVYAINSELATQYLSAELDGRIRLCDYCWLSAGFRYVELTEQLRMDLDAGAQQFAVDTNASNNLYGFQLGAITSMPLHQRLRLNVDVKGGVYGSDRQQTSVLDTGAGLLNANGSSSGAAFMGEIQAVAVASLTDCLSLRAGYDLLWLESVALGSNQLQVTDFLDGTGMHDGGSLLLHGFLLGVEFTH